MSIDLHTDCTKRIIEIITEQLPKVEVQHNMFLEEESILDLQLSEKALPQKGAIRDKLKQYIGEIPLSNFLYQTISRELKEKQEYDSETSLIKLTELEGYQNPHTVAYRLIESFKSLPWEYFLTIKLENDFGEIFCRTLKQYSICDSVRLTTPDEEFRNDFPLQSGIEARDRSLSRGLALGLGLLGTVEPEEWEENATYFQVKVDGFIGIYGKTVPLEDGVSLLKSFCGLSIALRILKVNYSYRSTPSKAKFYIHRNTENNWIIEREHEIEASTSDTFNDLVLHDIDGALYTEEKKVQWIKKNLDLIKCAFSNKEKARKIILAGQWLFESYCGENDLLSFVQTTVALEILLGDKSMSDLMGLGELLRNRCAYLIGKSHKQREEILGDFKRIYEIRSRIVHEGKSKLDFRERVLFSRLQWMCRRVIQEEMDLLLKDIKKTA